MSTLSGGPNMVTNGLVLYLDAANPNSYISGSTVWNDLTLNKNNGTLINGPTYSSANKGSIVFDGVNDYGQIPMKFSGSEGTFNYWVKTSNQSSYLFISNKGSLTANPSISNGIALFTPNWSVNSVICYVNNSTGTTNTSLQASIPINIRNDTWYYVSARLRYSGGTSTLSLGLNGSIITSSSRATEYTDFFNINNILYLCSLNNSIIYSNFSMALSQIYNRALTDAEILQNYNANKSRFGLI